MPNWQPNWNNVIWNYGAANDAANELRRSADMLEDTAGRRKRAADVARQEWRGRYRDEFDRDLASMLDRAYRLAQQMREKARQIDQASQRAEAEQTRRVRDRDRWEAERREEKRREDEARRRQEEERRRAASGGGGGGGGGAG